MNYQELNSLLIRWGDWQERHYLEPSLPQCSAHTRIFCDHPSGHRILCAEMDRAVYLLNIHILCLQGRSQDILLLWYAVNIKPSGGFWSVQEKAAKLETSVRALKVRLWRAKRSLRRLLENGLQKRSNYAISTANLSSLSLE